MFSAYTLPVLYFHLANTDLPVFSFSKCWLSGKTLSGGAHQTIGTIPLPISIQSLRLSFTINYMLTPFDVGIRQQNNQRSSFIDGTAVYGWNRTREIELRSRSNFIYLLKNMPFLDTLFCPVHAIKLCKHAIRLF